MDIYGKLVIAALLTMVTPLAVAGGKPAWDACFDSAGARYNIAPSLLRAIARQESSMNPLALNTSNRNGTSDQGLMGINSSWYDELIEFGITPQDLWEPCINIVVGAWVLANEVNRFGYTWEAVGAYNAGPSAKRHNVRMEYAKAISRRLAAD